MPNSASQRRQQRLKLKKRAARPPETTRDLGRYILAHKLLEPQLRPGIFSPPRRSVDGLPGTHLTHSRWSLMKDELLALVRPIGTSPRQR
jgi:hypothetical protein